MSKEEKIQKVLEARNMEELEEVKKEIATDEAETEETVESSTDNVENTTNSAEEKIKNTEPVEEVAKETEEEKTEDTEISKEEERSLLRDTENIERRSKNSNLKLIHEREDKKMEKELRNTTEYINAYAEYIKTGEDKELRRLLTTNVEGGQVLVPDLVDEVIRTAWERESLMARVRSISVAGNFKVEFEVSSTEAQVHVEGGEAVSEEELVLGIVTLTPQSIKKWISISDEALDMRGEAFLRYIYDELTYRIAVKTAEVLINKIKALPQTLTPNSEGIYDTVSADKVTAEPSVSTVATATAHLSPEAKTLTVVMNRLTEAKFVEAQLQANYPLDVFQNIEKVYTNALPSYDSANTNDVYMIVGDFDIGAMANYPNGEDVTIKFDDKTLMTQDLIRILGRRYVGTEAVADKAFVLVAKPTPAV